MSEGQTGIWGKILGGAAGFALGGPLGALLGLGAGHAVDRLRRDERPAEEKGRDATQSVAFTIGVIVLSAKMAKADGTVKRVEVDAFKRLFHVPPEEMRNVGRVFDLARRDTAGFEVYARQIAALFDRGHPVLEELLDSLFLIAEADDELHEDEVAYLREAARIFGFDDAAFARILAARPLGDGCAGDPWCVLGVPRDADQDTVKAAYRKLAHEHHPDRLVAQGLPPEFTDIATEKMARINVAYARVKGARVEG